MILAEIHLSPLISIPLAVAALALIVWYWRMLGDGEVPEPRRRIRRASLAVMILTLVVLVRGVSFLDDDIDPSNYTVTWAMAIALVLIIVFLAFLDMLNNLRIHRRHRAQAIAESRAKLMQAAIEARERTRARQPNEEDGAAE